MQRRLLEFLGGTRQVDAGRLTLRVLSAAQLLQARQEAASLPGTEADLGLRLNACVVAKAAAKRGRRVFSDGKTVLQRLSAEEIETLAAQYAALCRREAPGFGTDWEPLKQALADSPMERLKWRVQRSFLALPTEARVREMTESDYLYCALQLLLDKEERLAGLCPACRAAAMEGADRCTVCGGPLETAVETENPAFDLARFEELRDHGGGA
jgi:hypothetical protein